MAENGKGYIILDDGTKVPADKNGVPFPSHVAAEDPLETDYGSYEDEDEDDTDADVDDFGYVYNPKDDFKSCSTAVEALRKAGVRFDRTTWVKISSGSLEFSINLAE